MSVAASGDDDILRSFRHLGKEEVADFGFDL
jgi:hypothetical protein